MARRRHSSAKSLHGRFPVDLLRLNPTPRIAHAAPTVTARRRPEELTLQSQRFADRGHRRVPHCGQGRLPWRAVALRHFQSGSALSIERLRGEITFDYGLDQSHSKNSPSTARVPMQLISKAPCRQHNIWAAGRAANSVLADIAQRIHRQ